MWARFFLRGNFYSSLGVFFRFRLVPHLKELGYVRSFLQVNAIAYYFSLAVFRGVSACRTQFFESGEAFFYRRAPGKRARHLRLPVFQAG